MGFSHCADAGWSLGLLTDSGRVSSITPIKLNRDLGIRLNLPLRYSDLIVVNGFVRRSASYSSVLTYLMSSSPIETFSRMKCTSISMCFVRE